MRKFIWKIIVFAIVTFVVLLALNNWVHHAVYKTDYYGRQYRELTMGKNDADNVIIGTSHLTHGLQPAILNKSGHRFYNFALDGANPTYYLNWYTQLFKNHYKKPKYLILGVEWFFFDSKWLWRRYEQDSEYFPAELYRKHIFDKKYDQMMLNIDRYPVLKYRRTLLKELFDRDTFSYPAEQYKMGFIPYRVEYPNIVNFDPQNVWVDTVQKRDFEHLLKLFKADGIQVILLISPTYNTDAEKHRNLDVYTYFDSIAKARNLPLLNYNTGRRSHINSNPAYYADGGHLNYLGSFAFSKLLLKDLKTMLK